MMQQVLSPGVEDREKADACTQMAWVGGNRFQRLSAGLEQNLVDGLRILQGQRIELFGNGEHDMEVLDGQQFSLAPLDPFGPCRILAFRTMAVPARVVADALILTVAATFHMSAQG